jgi:hypothetical protein
MAARLTYARAGPTAHALPLQPPSSCGGGLTECPFHLGA